MVLYKLVECLNLDEKDRNEHGAFMNKHAIIEDSIKLYRKLQRTKKSRRSVLDTQMSDIRMLGRENPIHCKVDSKEHLVRCLVGVR